MRWNENNGDIPQFDDEEESIIFERQVIKMFDLQFAALVGSTLAMVPPDRRDALRAMIQDRTSCYAPFTADLCATILKKVDE